MSLILEKLDNVSLLFGMGGIPIQALGVLSLLPIISMIGRGTGWAAKEINVSAHFHFGGCFGVPQVLPLNLNRDMFQRFRSHRGLLG